jgi:hypothetical protein
LISSKITLPITIKADVLNVLMAFYLWSPNTQGLLGAPEVLAKKKRTEVWLGVR